MHERKPEGRGAVLPERQKEERRPGRDRQTDRQTDRGGGERERGRRERRGEGQKEGKEERKTSAPRQNVVGSQKNDLCCVARQETLSVGSPGRWFWLDG